MSLPLEIEEAFASLRATINANHRGQTQSLNKLQTLVIGHYADVHRLLRLYERRMERVEDHLVIPHDIEPEPAPRALPDPP